MDNDADHVDGSAIGQQADIVGMSVDASRSDAPQVLVRTHEGCPACAGDKNKRHSCAKRRAPPKGVETPARSSRQRRGKADESRSTAADSGQEGRICERPKMIDKQLIAGRTP